MRKNYSTLFCFLLFFFLNCKLLNAQQSQDSTSQKSGTGLPGKTPTIKEKGDFKSNAIKEYNEAYYVLNRVNKSIGLPPNNVNFQTPQATLEYFIVSSRENDYKKAAYALNLNLLPSNLSHKDAALLAEKLYFVINQRVKLNWDDLPDRPESIYKPVQIKL